MQFTDVLPVEVTDVLRPGDHLVMDYGSGDRLTVANYFAYRYYQVNRFTFADGTVSG